MSMCRKLGVSNTVAGLKIHGWRRLHGIKKWSEKRSNCACGWRKWEQE